MMWFRCREKYTRILSSLLLALMMAALSVGASAKQAKMPILYVDGNQSIYFENKTPTIPDLLSLLTIRSGGDTSTVINIYTLQMPDETFIKSLMRTIHRAGYSNFSIAPRNERNQRIMKEFIGEVDAQMKRRPTLDEIFNAAKQPQAEQRPLNKYYAPSVSPDQAHESQGSQIKWVQIQSALAVSFFPAIIIWCFLSWMCRRIANLNLSTEQRLWGFLVWGIASLGALFDRSNDDSQTQVLTWLFGFGAGIAILALIDLKARSNPSGSLTANAPSRPPFLFYDESPHPWRRCFARYLDILINGLIAFWMLINVISPEIYDEITTLSDNPTLQLAINSIIITVLSCFVSAAFVGYTGTSIGKWIFGIAILNHDYQKIGYKKALSREFKIYIDGMALGIPLICFFPMWSSYKRLTNTGTTQWDEDFQIKVIQRSNNWAQYLLGFAGVALLMFMRY